MNRLATSIFDQVHPPKIFDQLLIYVNLYQNAKHQAISLICSEDMADQKIMQYDWPRTSWPMSQEQTFLSNNERGGIHVF